MMIWRIPMAAGLCMILGAAPDEKKEDFADKLIEGRPAAPGDVALLVVQWMGEVEERLSEEFDPGQETQGQQAKILDALDDLIKSARPRKGGGGGGEGGEQADRRQKPEDSREGGDGSQSSANPGGDVGGDSVSSKATPADAGLEGGRFRESRRGWGHLPNRDREEVLQGIHDEVIERYRTMIDDYYRALAEMEERKR